MKKIILITLSIMIIIIGALAAWFFYELKAPVSKSDQNVFFEIKSGESTADIASELQSDNLVRSNWMFSFWVKYKKITLMPGLYYLRPNMTISEIANDLSVGNVSEYQITIPEGWTNKQIADYLAGKGIVSKEEFLTAANGYEGYLFPDTYRIAVKSTAQEIVTKMRENFDVKTAGLNIANDDVILASIVEKETKTAQDRRLVAGIYQNRLALDMPLQSCPTVLYAMGITKDRLSYADTQYDSLYNTYLYKGLPPGPICNPGLDAIEAVLNPTDSDYLFFLSDSNGNIHYAKTDAEQAANEEKYLN